jgi:hypothetical protein
MASVFLLQGLDAGASDRRSTALSALQRLIPAIELGMVVIMRRCRQRVGVERPSYPRQGEFRCRVCGHVLEIFDGSSEVALRLTVQPAKYRAKRNNGFQADEWRPVNRQGKPKL